MAQIKAADVSKLRNMTGAGMMDCKQALEEADGDFQAAIDVLRKKGQKLATKRVDREAREGAAIAKTSADGKLATIIVLNSETDFVSKNERFVNFANEICDLALANNPANLDELKNIVMADGHTIQDNVTNMMGMIGEKIELSFYDKIEAASTTAYIHPGNQLATLVGFNEDVSNPTIGKDVAMQIAAMNPVSLDNSDVPQSVIDKEIEIGMDLARQEGKAEDMLRKIAEGRLNKFFKESTLLNQEFIKDNKLSIRQYLAQSSKTLTVTRFVRFGLKN